MAKYPTIAALLNPADCNQQMRQPKIETKGDKVYKDGKFYAFIIAHNEKEKELTVKIPHPPLLVGKIKGDHTITTMYYN